MVKRLEPERWRVCFQLQCERVVVPVSGRQPLPGWARTCYISISARAVRSSQVGGTRCSWSRVTSFSPRRMCSCKLAALNADLAYGMYMFRSQPYMLNLFERYPGKSCNHGESLTV